MYTTNDISLLLLLSLLSLLYNIINIIKIIIFIYMQKIDITTNTPLTLSAGKKEIANSINYCSCKNLETDCWNHGLWSTFGKSYPEWICKLSSTLIRDCYGSDGTYVRVCVCECACVYV